MIQKILTGIKKIIFKTKPLNRRRYPRYQPKKEIFCSATFKIFNKTETINLKIINISVGGLLVSTGNFRIPPTTQMLLLFKSSQGDILAKISGQIGRTYRFSKDKQFYSSIEFDTPEDSQIQRLISYVL